MTKLAVRDFLAKGRLKKLDGSHDVRAEVLNSLKDPDWKVRRNALRFLDHAPVEGMASSIIELLSDEQAEVRKWAAHSLGCDRCKQGASLEVDPVPFLIKAADQDPSSDVRHSAIVCLAWNRPPDTRIAQLMKQLVASTSDTRLRAHAEAGALRHEMAGA